MLFRSLESYTRQSRAVFYSVLDLKNLRDLPFNQTGLLYRYRETEDYSPWKDYVLRGVNDISPDNYLGSAIAAEYFFHRGELERHKGRIERAARYYQKAATTAPRLEWVAMEGAKSLSVAKREDLALPLYENVLKINPAAVNYYLMGVANILAEKPLEAIPYLQEATFLSPQEPGYAFSLGMALQRSGQNNKAAQIFFQITQSQPTFLPARFNLAETYEKINPSQAYSYWQEYLKRAQSIPAEAAGVAYATERIAFLGRQ